METSCDLFLIYICFKLRAVVSEQLHVPYPRHVVPSRFAVAAGLADSFVFEFGECVERFRFETSSA